MLRNTVVQEGDLQVIIPYRLYREALDWIRRTHRSLTVDEFVAQAMEARVHTVGAIKRFKDLEILTVGYGSPMEIGTRWRGASMAHDDGLVRGAAFRERGAALRVLIKEEDLTL